MKKVAMVPIKLNNERLPNKNIKLLGDKPLVQYILDTLLSVSEIDKIYVFCSDEAIIPYLPPEVEFLKRDKLLDLPEANFTQFFDAFMQVIDAEVYVFTHATAPFIQKSTIEQCLDMVLYEGYDSAFTASKIQDFLWKDKKPMNFDAANLPRSQDLEPIYRETSGVYVFKKDVFKKWKRRIGENPYIVEVSWREAVDINTYEDFEIAQMIIGRSPAAVLNLIFDLDGVLINSEKVQEQSFYESYREVVGDGNCPNFSEYMKHTGDSLPNIFRKMGLPVEMAIPYRRISSECIDKILINWEVIDFIRNIKKRNVRCAICTGKDRKRTLDILKYFHLEDVFDAVVCSDDVDTPKPSAVPTLAAMKRIGAIKENVLLIGDGYYDIQSARNAGIRSVLTLWYGDLGVPRESDYVAKTVADLKDIVYSLMY